VIACPSTEAKFGVFRRDRLFADLDLGDRAFRRGLVMRPDRWKPVHHEEAPAN
jgi:hypothetical protein